MNTKPFIIGTLVACLTFAALHGLLHGVVLSDLYEITKGVWRSENARNGMLPILIPYYLVICLGFVYLFARGYRGKGWAEGVRYGLVFGFVMATAGSIEKFLLLDIPARLALGWFMGTLFQYMIMGIMTAVIYRQFSKSQ